MNNYEVRIIREQIIEELHKIDNIWILQQIWMVVQNIQK